MKHFAAFIMRGRLQATMVAAMATFSLFFAWVGAAVLALVILRLGFNSAIAVFVASLIPSVMWASQGEVGPITAILAVVILASALRYTRQWSSVLLLGPLVFGIWGMLLLFLAPDFVEKLVVQAEVLSAAWIDFLVEVSANNEAYRELATQMIDAMKDAPKPTGEALIGNFVALQLPLSILSLVFARWWQATLYNPGGFQQEFHNLHLSRMEMLVLVAGVLVLYSLGISEFWAWLFVIPMMIVGLSLVHYTVSQRNMSFHWLVLFYVLLVTITPVMQLLMVLAIVDSALNIRSRMAGDTD